MGHKIVVPQKPCFYYTDNFFEGKDIDTETVKKVNLHHDM